MHLFSFLRIKQIPKNILIFFPLLISQQQISYFELTKLFLSFITFSIITLILYFVNDCTDIKIDKLNKLKKIDKNKIKILNNQNLIFSNVLLFVFLLFLTQTIFFKYSLLIYICLFYLYNFIFKKIKYIDIFFLISFYVCRIFYGSEIINLTLTNWFLFFFISLFAILSIHKRSIQIKINKLNKKNNIIAYNQNDISVINLFLIVLTFLNLLTFFYYLIDLGQIIDLRIIILFLYSFTLLYILNMSLKSKIKVDIYNFVFKDKKIVNITVIVTVLIILDYIL